jgi:hypothetical protein
VKQHYLKKNSIIIARLLQCRCQDDNNETPALTAIILKYSAVPALAVAKRRFQNLQITSLLSSSDVVESTITTTTFTVLNQDGA